MKPVNLLLGSLLVLTVFMYINQKPIVELFVSIPSPVTGVPSYDPHKPETDDSKKENTIIGGVLGGMLGLAVLYFIYILFFGRRR